LSSAPIAVILTVGCLRTVSAAANSDSNQSQYVAITDHTEMEASSGTGASSSPVETPVAESEPGGAQLLRTDIQVAFVLLNEARHRALEYVGVPRDRANLVTFFALAIAADSVHDRSRRLFRRPPAPSAGEVLLGMASAREVARAIAGPAADTPLFGTLIALALVGRPTRRVVSGSVHAARSGLHDMHSGFRHRYGYLIDPGHWRARRQARREIRD
jgi:hypothetical protein